MPFQATRAISLPAGAAIAQRRFVKVDAAGKVIQAAAAGDDVVGVSLEAAAAVDDVIPVAMMGGEIAQVEAGAIVTLGSLVTSDATGRAVNGGAAAARMNGYALEAAGAAGEFITVLLSKGASHTSATGV